MTRVVFRCDASASTGGGHVARCMALAHALRKRGAEVELVTRGLPPRLRDLLVASAGAVVHELGEPPGALSNLEDPGEPVDHAAWLPVPQKVDAAQTIEVLRAPAPVDWLVVDHYALDARWELEVASHAGAILVIDDLADRDHACDVLLDQNFFLDAETRYQGRVPPRAEVMLGPRYALLRSGFGEARKSMGARTGELKRIFVCFGGFDTSNQTSRALEAIASASLEGVAVDVMIGTDHPYRKDVEAHCAGRDGYHLHLDAGNVAELMLPADLAIGASGIMNWERAALGLPAIVTSVAENQHTGAGDLAADRACIYLGPAGEWRVETLRALLQGLSGTPTLLRALAVRAAALTDGEGARRVAARLLPLPITLRRATLNDGDSLHAWRNTDESRRYSGDSAAIAIEHHREWFARVLNDTGAVLLVGEYEMSPVGVLRYDVEGDRARVSVYLTPGRHGHGLGSALIRAGTRWLRENRPGVTRLDAEIRCENAASLKAFENAGYRARTHIHSLELRHG